MTGKPASEVHGVGTSTYRCLTKEHRSVTIIDWYNFCVVLTSRAVTIISGGAGHRVWSRRI